ncbi:MAG: endolytic transglycosylase MltG [Candidatus Moraniibacteriota bacterium]
MSFLNKSLLGLVFFVLILAIGGWIVFGKFQEQVYNSTESDSNIKKTIEVKKNQSGKDVGKMLEEMDLVKSKYHFYYYIWQGDLASGIQAGEYEISPNMTIPEIVSILTNGEIKQEYKKLTIPEGFTNKKIIEKLEETAPKIADDFQEIVNCKCLAVNNCSCDKLSEKYDFLGNIPEGVDMEGYLFPDTYFIYPEESALDLVKKFLNNFQKKTAGLERENPSFFSKRNFHEIITMASIIEKEVSNIEDKRLVSGIFWKRVEDEYPLQSCATLAYALGVNKEQYSTQDTEVDSPYNTYKNPGLPPGPVSNPSIESIKAAVNPKESDYYYFLNNQETGETVFSETLEKHNLNKERHGL